MVSCFMYVLCSYVLGGISLDCTAVFIMLVELAFFVGTFECLQLGLELFNEEVELAYLLLLAAHTSWRGSAHVYECTRVYCSHLWLHVPDKKYWYAQILHSQKWWRTTQITEANNVFKIIVSFKFQKYFSFNFTAFENIFADYSDAGFKPEWSWR